MEAHKRGFKGVWLCAALYESQELSAVEKLLLAEIDALTTEFDACYATNAHFSDRLGVTVTRVDHLLGKLTRLGYIIRVSFDGRVTRRVVAAEYSSNPAHSIALVGRQRQSWSVENDRAVLSQNAKQDCKSKQGRAAKSNRATYIEKIPEQIPTLETTTTIKPPLDNQIGHDHEAGEASPRRSFAGQELSESEGDDTRHSEAANSTASIDQLVQAYGLSQKQREIVSEYRDSKGAEYVRSKVEIVRAKPRRNAAGALMAALRDDWQPPVSTKGQTNATPKIPVRAGNRNIGNSNEYCDTSQYKSRD
jgi:hypothetical protein